MLAAPLQRCSDKLLATMISSNALDPLLFYDTRDYQSLLMLSFCVRNVGRQTQPTVMKINGTRVLHFYHAHKCSHFFLQLFTLLGWQIILTTVNIRTSNVAIIIVIMAMRPESLSNTLEVTTFDIDCVPLYIPANVMNKRVREKIKVHEISYFHM
jgi:hypothetical protein